MESNNWNINFATPYVPTSKNKNQAHLLFYKNVKDENIKVYII